MIAFRLLNRSPAHYLAKLSRTARASLRGLRTGYCPVPLPWSTVGRNDDEMSRLHRLALSLVDHYPDYYHTPVALAWGPLSLLQAAAYVRRYGPGVKQLEGIGLVRQWVQLVRLAHLYNAHLPSYYLLRWWRPDNLRRVDRYVYAFELWPLLTWLNQRQGVDMEPFQDKALFFEHCTRLGLPTIPVLLHVDRGERRWYLDAEALPREDLFLKPALLSQGRGAQRWRYEPASDQWARAGKLLDEAALLAHVDRLSHEDALIVQPRADNQAQVVALTGTTLASLRLVTLNLPGSAGPEVLVSYFRLPSSASEVDNFSAGGVAAGVTPDGTLLHAMQKDPCAGTFTHHPETGRLIPGTKVPGWDEMVALALEAHRCFERPLSIGWDVAYTPSGPVLIEANMRWAVDSPQMTHDLPLGETKLIEVLASELRRYEQEHAS